MQLTKPAAAVALTATIILFSGCVTTTDYRLTPSKNARKSNGNAGPV